MQQIYPAADPAGLGPDPVTALGALYAYPEPGRGPWLPAGRPWVRANMVASADGAAALAGRTRGLSGTADRLVFAVLRSLADVILVGAQTARTERYRPVQPAELYPQLRPAGLPPPIAVVTRLADLGSGTDGGLLDPGDGAARTIVLTTAEAPAGRLAAARRHAEVIVAGRREVPAAAVISALAGRGYRRILAEGGPALLAQITAAGLLDELCLTYAPVLAGGPAGRILTGGPPVGLRLAHVLADEGHLICRYLRRADDPAQGP